LYLASGAAALTFAISEAPRYSIGSVTIQAALIAGAVLIGLFIVRSGRVSDPVLDLRLLRRRRVASAAVTTALYSCAFFGLLFTFVLFFVSIWHLSVLEAGLMILPIGLLVAGMTLRVGRVAERFGFRLPLVLGSVLMAVGLGTAVELGGPSYTPAWFAAEIVIGIGIGLCYPLLIAASVADLPPADLAAASAVAQCARQLGAAVGVAVAVAVLGPADSPTSPHFHAAWLIAAGFSAVAAVTATAIGKD
jgi:predicted MFS family arabinose efflux permease